MPAQRRRLTDLYVKGTSCTVTDGQGDIEVWLQKLNPLERENAARRAGAERARMVAFYEDKDSDEYQSAVNDVLDFYQDRESLTTMIIRNDVMRAQARIEAELAGDGEWSKDGLLVGLIDAWQDGLSDRYAEDPNDPEASRVFKMLEKFDTQVQEEVIAERLRLEKDMGSHTLEELRDKAVERLIDAKAISAFIEEFEIQRLLYSVRDPEKHDEYYFTNRLEVKTLDEKIREQLSAAYSDLEIDLVEGKDLPETEDSSVSSEQSGTEDQVQPSGRKAVPVSKMSQETSQQQ